MDENKLLHAIRQKRSYLCVGLDSDINKIPKHLHSFYDPVFEFNKRIVDATKEYAVAYKLNLAFYEVRGVEGWRSLERTISIIPSDCLLIADAKRGDIFNSSAYYAKTFFETYNFNAVTVNPYMGIDSIEPYLSYFEKWAFVLTLTTNPGSGDFQRSTNSEGVPIYQQVIEKCLQQKWKGILGFVVGSTQTEQMKEIRDLAPQTPLLIPGIGTQGGDLAQTCAHLAGPNSILLINAARTIIFAGIDKDFEDKAEACAADYVKVMAPFFE
jgi:orotidine-5'-phosphate decarboxylase